MLSLGKILAAGALCTAAAYGASGCASSTPPQPPVVPSEPTPPQQPPLMPVESTSTAQQTPVKGRGGEQSQPRQEPAAPFAVRSIRSDGSPAALRPGPKAVGAEPTVPTPLTDPAQPQVHALPKGSTVLHVGDSFAGALGYELNRQLKEHGVKGVLKYEKSTYIPTWAWNAELAQHLRRYTPDLVVITLGGNELKIPDPDARIPTLQRLVKRLAGTPCVWVGIPVWEGANPHLMRVVEQHIAPCRFVDSVKIYPDMPRAKDKIHPSKSARAEWARRVIEWMQHHVSAPDDSTRWAWRDDVRATSAE